MEYWKAIPGSLSYEVSTEGNVRNAITKKVLSQSIGSSNYKQIGLVGDIQKTVMVHRLIAKSFLDNAKNKPQVNHIDGNKHNNKLDNLEWVTSSENMRHAYDNGLKTYKPLHYKGKFGAEHNKSKPVALVAEDGTIEKRFAGISEASRETNTAVSNICYSCKSGNRNRRTKLLFTYL